eukprot:6283363-Ditylum_brightwellii.AAC.1
MDKPLVGKSSGPDRGTVIEFKKLKVPSPTDKLHWMEHNRGTGVLEDADLFESFLNHLPLQ